MFSPTTVHPVVLQMAQQQRWQIEWRRAIEVEENKVNYCGRVLAEERSKYKEDLGNPVLQERCARAKLRYEQAGQELDELIQEAQEAKREDGSWKYGAPDVHAYSPDSPSFDPTAEEPMVEPMEELQNGESKCVHE